MSNLNEILTEGLAAIEVASDSRELDDVRVKYLGKNGILTESLKNIGKLSPEERPTAGQKINEIKVALHKKIAVKKDNFIKEALAAKLREESIDVTLPGRGQKLGHLHPITQSMQRLNSFFERMGFQIAEGPEIESDYYNFEALNIPEHHPARSDHDTFFFDKNTVLRTHTSNVQIRVMEMTKPPIRVVAPGRVYRCDYDVTHTPMFHQIEGLYIDKGVNFGHLKGILNAMLSDFFETEIVSRFRPSYFPFTEPSAEMDIKCLICGGEGCRVCGSGWIELLGCGMVHPNVLKAGNIDHREYSGYAFGVGIDRLTMLRYGINDLRLFFDNDLRFVEQF